MGVNFKDIPQFIQNNSHDIDFTMIDLVRRIEKWEKEEGLEMNPIFQRGNVWTEEQQIRYIEFLLRGGKTSKIIYLNRKSLDPIEDSKKMNFVCIDGLQRYTAMKRFVNNQIQVFGCYMNEYEDARTYRRKIIGLKINTNSLQTNEEILQWYLDLNTRGTIHSKKEILRVKKLLKEEQERKDNNEM